MSLPGNKKAKREGELLILAGIPQGMSEEDCLGFVKQLGIIFGENVYLFGRHTSEYLMNRDDKYMYGAVTDLVPKQGKTARLFTDHFPAYPEKGIVEKIFLKYAKMHGKRMKKKNGPVGDRSGDTVGKILKALDLDLYRKRTLAQLSHMQKARVWLGTLLIQSPWVYVMMDASERLEEQIGAVLADAAARGSTNPSVTVMTVSAEQLREELSTRNICPRKDGYIDCPKEDEFPDSPACSLTASVFNSKEN